MPDPLPTGLMCAPLASLATLISESSTFQSWTGSANAAEALTRIHIEAMQFDDDGDIWMGADGADADMPYAVIFYNDVEWTYEYGQFSGQTIDVGFRAQVSDDYKNNPTLAFYEFCNADALGGVIADMAQAGGHCSEGFVMGGLSFQLVPQREDEAEGGGIPFYQCYLRVTGGETGGA